MNQTKSSNAGLKIVIVIAVVVVLLLGTYLAGNFVFPSAIKSSYQSKNCEQVLSLDSTYKSIYPALLIDQSVTELSKECGLYSFAVEYEQKKVWQDAYNGYKSYKQNYPNGLFVGLADEHSAQILVNWAKDDLTAKKYSNAIGHLKSAMESYGTTHAAVEAANVMADVYLGQAKDERETGDYAGAEATLKAFKTWATSAKNNENAKVAQRELAQTYLAWGLAFQAQKKFEDALSKFELVVSTDPEPLAKNGPSADAKVAKVKLYTEWGDFFIAKNDFAGALDRYQTVISFSDEKDLVAARDHVAEVYIKWATTLSGTEDFTGALQKIDDATKNAASDSEKKSLENTKSNIYTAFSKSSGKQATDAMKVAMKDVCEKNKKPTLPIFGLDKDHILASIYGVEDKLPDNVIAKTPGEMHYVACIDMQTDTVQTMMFYWAKFVREKYTWNVTLRSVDSPETITGTTKIVGGVPPALPQITRANYLSYLLGSSFYRSRGSNPDGTALANWLLPLMK